MQAYLAEIVGSEDLVDRALELLIVSGGQRPKQLLRVPVTGVNLREATMLLYDPKGRRKTPRPHLVPLGPRGLEIAAALVERAKKLSSPYLFSITGTHQLLSYPVSRRVADIRAKLKKEEKLTGGHFMLKDVRRTAETYLVALGVLKDFRGQLLSHGISGVQSKHYDMHDYLAEKRDAVARLERRLAQTESGDFGSPKVVALARRSQAA